MRKIVFLSIFAFLAIFISGCDFPMSNNPSEESKVVLYEICNDLALPCRDVYEKEIDRYGADATRQHNARSVDISGDRQINSKVDEYLQNNDRTMDIYNMADGIEGSLMGYSKDNTSCSILGSWELDEEFIPTGDGEISVSCF